MEKTLDVLGRFLRLKEFIVIRQLSRAVHKLAKSATSLRLA